MKIQDFEYKEATMAELDLRWDKNIADNAGDHRWVTWKSQAIENHRQRKGIAFVVLHDGNPIGEGTLLFLPHSIEINGLRIDKPYEGKGHISKLVKVMEQYAKRVGYNVVTIGVEPKETRNLAIYLHWGYDTFVKLAISDFKQEEGLVLYYAKNI